MIDVIVSGGMNLTVEDTGDIINVVVEVAAPISVEVVVGVPTKENIVGLSKVDSPEFADVVLPEIAEESSYTASAWAWLTGLFGVVTGSVKAMLVALVDMVASLDERVGELEDAYLVKVQVEQDVAFIELSQDKNGRPFDFKEGDKIELIVRLKRNPYGGVFVLLNSNETETNKYAYSTAISFGFPLATATTTYNVLNGRVCISLSFNEAVFKSEMNVQYEIGSRTTSMVVGETLNKNMTSVNKITLMAAGSGVIEAGSNVIVKRG